MFIRSSKAINNDNLIVLCDIQRITKDGHQRINIEFKKDEKVNLMHIAICKLLEPYGYYEFEFFDKEGWPHYKVVKDELINQMVEKRKREEGIYIACSII